MMYDVCFVGTGLAAGTICYGLGSNVRVVFVELSETVSPLTLNIEDAINLGDVTDTAAVGPGGSTNLWHNGLIEPDQFVLQNHWPISATELNFFIHRAWRLFVSSKKLTEIKHKSKILKDSYIKLGFPEIILGNHLYYPNRRFNSFKDVIGKYGHKVVYGMLVDAFSECSSGENEVKSLSVMTSTGVVEIKAKDFVISAGGLNSPKLLKDVFGCKNTMNLGRYYHDHPTTFVGQITLKKRIFKLWNFPVAGGFLRMPFVVDKHGLQVSFQLRPSYSISNPRGKHFKSLISQYRNDKFNIFLLFKILKDIDEFFEILSLKFRLKLPSRKYHILMVAEQSRGNRVTVDVVSPSQPHVKWLVSKDDLLIYDASINDFLQKVNHLVEDVIIDPTWKDHLQSSAHHCGTVPMSSNQNSTVNSNFLVRGFLNLFVCDASIIPRTGFANPGLMIAACGLRLAQHLKHRRHSNG